MESWNRLSTSPIEFQCLLGETMRPGWAQLLVASGLLLPGPRRDRRPMENAPPLPGS